MQKTDPFLLYLISAAAALPLILSFLIKKEVALEVRKNIFNKKILGVVAVRMLVAILANVLFYLALNTGPVSLVSAVVAISPVTTLLIMIFVSRFWPKFIKENITRAVLLQKALAIILIVGGVILINV